MKALRYINNELSLVEIDLPPLPEGEALICGRDGAFAEYLHLPYQWREAFTKACEPESLKILLRMGDA